MNWKNIKFSLILFVFAGIILVNIISAQSNEDIFKQANKFYKDNNYMEALKLYEKLIEKNIKNENLFYNAGNAYFRLNMLGPSILYYEKALALKPFDKDIIANIKYANLKKIDRDVETEQNPFTKFLIGMYDLFTINSALMFASISYFLLIALIIALMFRKKISKFIPRKEFINYGFYIMIPLFVIMTSISIIKISNAKTMIHGIILQPQVEVKSGPGEEYTTNFPLHEGSKVRIRQLQEGYYLISLPNGYNGWVKKEFIGVI